MKALRSMTQRMVLTQEEMVSLISAQSSFCFGDMNLICYSIYNFIGGGCPKKVLACTLLGFSSSIW